MKLSEMSKKLSLINLTPQTKLDQREVSEGYVSDLLSDVLAHAPKGGVLVTVQVHLNVIAVAVHAELSAVIFAMDRVPDEAVKTKAIEEGIPLLVSKATAFEVVGQLYELGLRGPRS